MCGRMLNLYAATALLPAPELKHWQFVWTLYPRLALVSSEYEFKSRVSALEENPLKTIQTPTKLASGCAIASLVEIIFCRCRAAGAQPEDGASADTSAERRSRHGLSRRAQKQNGAFPYSIHMSLTGEMGEVGIDAHKGSIVGNSVTLSTKLE